MKIVDVCAFYAPQGGGVRTYIDLKLAAGPAAGHEIVVIAPGECNRVEERGNGARIIWLESPRFPLDFSYRYFADAAALHAVLDREAPDLVEASSPWRSASMVVDWRGPAPRSLIMHADPLAVYAYRWFEGLAARPTVDKHFDWFWRHLRRLDARFDIVISASTSLSERLAAGGLRNVVTNPMGIDPGSFSPALRDIALRKQLLQRCALDEDATLLIGVGRHAPEKRWPMVIDAVVSAGYRKPVGLILVGDGRGRARVVRQVGDNPHIQLLARTSGRPELARLMASADALIHGGEAETFCIVAAEARASGLPLIVPDAGGAADQARVSGGWLYESGNAASLAAAVVDFVDRRPAPPVRGEDTTPALRTMNDHFAALFDDYEQLLAPVRKVA